MPFVRLHALSCLAALFAAATASAGDAPRVSGEPSRTPATKSLPAWRAAEVSEHAVARLRYGEMSAERILDLSRTNARGDAKRQAIGIGRTAASESVTGRLPSLRWVGLADGSSVAQVEVTSPLAYGIRVGLAIDSLPQTAELRFSGSARPRTIVATLRGDQVLSLLDSERVFWTPGTDGETQRIELWIPADSARETVRFSAPGLSHLMTNPIDDFKILSDIGESGSCNINAVCRVGLGQSYVNTKASVAKLTFVSGQFTYRCTGTLLNDTDAGTQIPYIHTAHHCISTQAEASTLNTYWNFESTTCGSDSLGQYTLLAGGADFLYSNEPTDGALLRMREPAPTGAVFAGWDANPLASGASITAIHHPQGDLKKVSLGTHTATYTSQIEVGWLEGTTEGGSSGSAIFTSDSTSYYLRGGLHRGAASCANTGNLSNSGNYDIYSRFDVDFPSIRQYLYAPPAAPVRRNGSQPLRPR